MILGHVHKIDYDNLCAALTECGSMHTLSELLESPFLQHTHGTSPNCICVFPACIYIYITAAKDDEYIQLSLNVLVTALETLLLCFISHLFCCSHVAFLYIHLLKLGNKGKAEYVFIFYRSI